MPLHLPKQGVVDRRGLLSLEPTVDREVHVKINNQDTVIQILRGPVDGAYGFDPNDPVWFPPQVNPRTAICQMLSPYAASSCLQRGGYF